MQRASKTKDTTIAEIMAGLEAGDDPRQAMARLNAKIVDYQRAGEAVPSSLLRLTQVIAVECAAHSQGR
ncbi:MAG: hypothetical protein ACKVP7_26330 [Hyphomicrobiaceae bacterium]